MTGTIDFSQWQELDTLLDQALALDEVDRLEFLDALDAPRRHQLDALLKRCDDSIVDGMVAAGIDQAMDDLECQQPDDPGSNVGRWRILDVLGSGGSAQVYRAECAEHDYVQQAAIKVLWGYAPDSTFHDRFLRERRILASLNHVNIARFLDGGMLDDGRPWLAMEFVDGVSIVEHCRALPVDRQIEVFLELCAALEFAHSRSIVHRDIKPANVLVDTHSRPRLLDFGIALITNDSEVPQLTRTGGSMLTLQYASPEQLGDDFVGVPSDVYQLGALLFEILTQVPVFDLKGASLDRAIRTIRDARPPLPSSMKPGLPTDLDAIVLKALSKEPALRYASVSMLADDLRRHIAGRPISARPYSRWDVMRRFLRRHRIAAAAGATIVLLVLAQVVMLSQHNQQLALERDLSREAQVRAESMHEFVLDIFGSVDPQLSATRGKSIDDLVIDGMQKARDDFPDQPVLAAQLIHDMSTLLKRRGKLDEAVAGYRDVLALRTAQFGDSHPETVAVLPDLAEALVHAGSPETALEISQRHLEHTISAHGKGSVAHVWALRAAAPIVSAASDNPRALAMIDEALLHFQSLQAEGQIEEADELILETEIQHQRAVLLIRENDYVTAAPLLVKAVARFDALFGKRDSRSLEARNNLAFALRFLKRPDEARQVLEEALELQRELFKGPHWRSAYTLGHLANLSSDEGDYATAIDLWQASELEALDAVGEHHPWVISARIARARSMLLHGLCEAGEALLTQIIARTDLKPGGRASAETTLERYRCSPDTVSDG